MSPEEFQNCLRQCGVFPGARVLAAVSGGADSVCLLWLLAGVRKNFPLEVLCAHAEHGLRGADSLGDMEHVLRLCDAWNIRVYTRHLDVRGYAEAHKMGTEETARKLRYDFLSASADEQHCDFIALAHHRRDQAETVLLRAARGTDIRGLAAMQKKRGRFIRPLLDCDPEELRTVLLENGISWREDATNADVHYARNRVRRNVLPELRKISPEADAALCRLASAAARDEAYFRQQLEELGLAHPLMLSDGAAIPAGKLSGLHPALATRALNVLLEAAGAETDAGVMTQAMTLLAKNQNGKLNLPGRGQLILEERWIGAVFPKRPVPEIVLQPGENQTLFGKFTLEKCPEGENGDGKHAQRIPWKPGMKLTVGSREPGESIVPFGHHHPQELRKLIAGSGLNQIFRRSVPVIRLDGVPVWLAGIRPSEVCRTLGKENWILRYEGNLPE